MRITAKASNALSTLVSKVKVKEGQEYGPPLPLPHLLFIGLPGPPLPLPHLLFIGR